MCIQQRGPQFFLPPTNPSHCIDFVAYVVSRRIATMFAVSGFTHPFPHKYGHSPGYIIQLVQFYSSLFRTVYSCNGKSACVHGYMPATSRNLLMVKSQYVLLMFPILGWLIHISPSWSPNLFRWNPQSFPDEIPHFHCSHRSQKCPASAFRSWTPTAPQRLRARPWTGTDRRTILSFWFPKKKLLERWDWPPRHSRMDLLWNIFVIFWGFL